MKTQNVQPLTAGGLICLNLGTYVQVINVTKQTYSSAMLFEIDSVNIFFVVIRPNPNEENIKIVTVKCQR